MTSDSISIWAKLFVPTFDCSTFDLIGWIRFTRKCLTLEVSIFLASPRALFSTPFAAVSPSAFFYTASSLLSSWVSLERHSWSSSIFPVDLVFNLIGCGFGLGGFWLEMNIEPGLSVLTGFAFIIFFYFGISFSTCLMSRFRRSPWCLTSTLIPSF